jgi:hypothetical protein
MDELLGWWFCVFPVNGAIQLLDGGRRRSRRACGGGDERLQERAIDAEMISSRHIMGTSTTGVARTEAK